MAFGLVQSWLGGRPGLGRGWPVGRAKPDRRGRRRAAAGRHGSHLQVLLFAPHPKAAVEPLLHCHFRLSQVRQLALRQDLVALVVIADRVVILHLSRLLVAQDRRQIKAFEAAVRVSGTGCGEGVCGVPPGHIVLLEELIGRVDRADPLQAQLFDQPVLRGAKEALDAPFGRRPLAVSWRVGDDEFDVQFP